MIELKNVSKKYDRFLAVEDINIKIEKGEIVGLLGPNGAGKSTIMNMITGFIEPTEGEILIDGLDIEKKAKKVKSIIGYMPEGTPLYKDLTVNEFVSFMAELKKVKNRKEEVRKTLESVGISEVANQLIRNLSRGYKQRVSMAGALVGNPEILILDEPTVGLDPVQITEIRQLIKDLAGNNTVILSSHIIAEVSQICSKIIVVNKGKIIDIDTPENLEKKTGTDNLEDAFMSLIKEEVKVETEEKSDNEEGSEE